MAWPWLSTKSNSAAFCSSAGHKGPVHRVCFTADGSVLATGGADHTVRTWEVRGVGGAMASNTPLSVAPATFRTKGTPVLDVAFTSRNLLLAAGPS
jgi:transcription initiation factor TFIID subunit 5